MNSGACRTKNPQAAEHAHSHAEQLSEIVCMRTHIYAKLSFWKIAKMAAVHNYQAQSIPHTSGMQVSQNTCIRSQNISHRERGSTTAAVHIRCQDPLVQDRRLFS